VRERKKIPPQPDSGEPIRASMAYLHVFIRIRAGTAAETLKHEAL
jgi:hypothetical protein